MINKLWYVLMMGLTTSVAQDDLGSRGGGIGVLWVNLLYTSRCGPVFTISVKSEVRSHKCEVITCDVYENHPGVEIFTCPFYGQSTSLQIKDTLQEF